MKYLISLIYAALTFFLFGVLHNLRTHFDLFPFQGGLDVTISFVHTATPLFFTSEVPSLVLKTCIIGRSQLLTLPPLKKKKMLHLHLFPTLPPRFCPNMSSRPQLSFLFSLKRGRNAARTHGWSSAPCHLPLMNVESVLELQSTTELLF